MTIDNLLKDFILEAEDVGTEQHLYEHIMVLVAEARWQRRLSQGLLKVADLRRIQKHKGGPDPLYVKQLMKQGKEKAANSYLKKKGLVKSARTWLAGVEKGTKNILKKYKAKVVHKPDAAFTNQAAAAGMADFAGLKKGQTMRNPMGAHAKVTKGGKRARVHVATGVKKKDQGMQTVFKRHEADEVRAAIKQTKMKKGKGVAVPLRQDAGHMSSEVLRKERELVRTAKALYGKKSGGKKIAKMRDATGEYDSIKGQTKKSIAKSDKAQRSEYIDAVRAQKKQIRAASPEERAEAIKDLRSQLKDVGLSNKDMKMVIQAIT